MASNSATGTARTAPKGRATHSQSDGVAASGMSPMLQWALVVVAAIAVIGAIFYFGRDVRSDLGGGHSGAPAPAEVFTVASS